MRIYTKRNTATNLLNLRSITYRIMTDFAAIDFETANGCASSVCSVGVVVVRNGIITDKFYSLIHPAPNYYSPGNTAIHGLTRKETDSAAYFPDVWGRVEPLIEGLPLVAHFSRFDERCLRAAFSRYGMNYPEYRFFCTCNGARRHFGRSLPNHKLDTVAEACGFTLVNHHNAIADAEACAAIAMSIL